MPHMGTLRMMRLMDSIRAAWGIEYPFEKAPAEEAPAKAAAPAEKEEEA